MKYFVARQECKSNQLLHFSSNTKHSHIVYCYMYASNNANGTSACVSMATMVMQTCYNAEQSCFKLRACVVSLSKAKHTRVRFLY